MPSIIEVKKLSEEDEIKGKGVAPVYNED